MFGRACGELRAAITVRQPSILARDHLLQTSHTICDRHIQSEIQSKAPVIHNDLPTLGPITRSPILPSGSTALPLRVITLRQPAIRHLLCGRPGSQRACPVVVFHARPAPLGTAPHVSWPAVSHRPLHLPAPWVSSVALTPPPRPSAQHGLPSPHGVRVVPPRHLAWLPLAPVPRRQS